MTQKAKSEQLDPKEIPSSKPVTSGNQMAYIKLTRWEATASANCWHPSKSPKVGAFTYLHFFGVLLLVLAKGYSTWVLLSAVRLMGIPRGSGRRLSAISANTANGQ